MNTASESNPHSENKPTKPFKQPINSVTLGVLFALAGTLLFSIKPIFVKMAYQHGGDAVSIMTLRTMSSLPVYLCILFWMLRKSEHRTQVKSHGLKAAVIGVLGYYLASYLDITALNYISAQLERLLLFLFPTFVVLIMWLTQAQVPNRNIIIAALVGYVGVGLIVAHDLSQYGDQIWLGGGLAILSAFVFAVYLVLSKASIAKLGSTIFTSIGMGSAGVAILVHLVFSDLDLQTLSHELIIIGVLLGLFCTVIPSYLIAAAMARLNPAHLSLVSNVGPAMTALCAILILGESFTWFHAVGMTLTILSVVMINRNK
jgi:drug/metabolite transporter (DMT)-like permease